VEATEVVADDDEHAIGLLGILDLGQEVGGEAEGQGDLRGLIKVRLEDALVEDEEALEDLEVELVVNSAAELVVELRVGEGLHGLETLVGEGRSEGLCQSKKVINNGETHPCCLMLSDCG